MGQETPGVSFLAEAESAQVVERFHVALMLNRGVRSFVETLLDETTLAAFQLHLPGQILHRHGDAP